MSNTYYVGYLILAYYLYLINSHIIIIRSLIMTDNNKNLPGWNEFISPEKEKALFWRGIWINKGSPRQGYVADIMRRTRAKYHYAIRRIKIIAN